MNPFNFPALLMIAAMALLSACGGEQEIAADQAPASPALVAANAPVADCEAEGCNRPRIIDGLAEQFRADAIAQRALADATPPSADAALQP